MTDKDLEKRIAERAAQAEQQSPDTPDLLHFSGIVKETKKRIARRQRNQLILFIAVAIVLFSAVVLFAFMNVAVFAAAQLVPVVIFGILYLRERRTGGAR